MDDYQRRGLPVDEYGIAMDDVRLDIEPDTGVYYLCQVRKHQDMHPSVQIALNRDTLIKNNPNIPDHLNLRLKYFGPKETVQIKEEFEMPSSRWVDFFIQEFKCQRNVSL